MDEQLQILPYVILFLPIVAAAFETLLTLRDGKLCAGISIGAVWISFICSCALWIIFQAGGIGNYSHSIVWASAGDIKFEIGYFLDRFSILMLIVVTLIAGLIHIYSIGYMSKDKAMGRYFACLSLFTSSMLGIVLAPNFLMLFICWELVGLSSYLLIGHWHARPSAADAAKKAFLTNRLGDFGFLLGILLIWGSTGSIRYDEVSAWIARNPNVFGALGAVAGLLIFCGALGKSAQFPLHVWLPDAMEGPTPVSALIHAATMVAAGVFMLCRVFFLFSAKPLWPESLAFMSGVTPLDVIAWVGAITALLSALIAIQQNDIKRILAYSTLSQLGYMVLAVGLSGPSPAMFHLITHAFFKALLFLCAGSVIIALHHQQDIWTMGGLRKKMPITFFTFLIATLAICGIPPFSGFYSKDAILLLAHTKSAPLYWLTIAVAALTAFYMFRLLSVVFLGEPRDKYAYEHTKESPPVMTIPLVVLTIATVAAGLIGIDELLNAVFGVAQTHGSLSIAQRIVNPFVHSKLVAFSGLVVSLIGIVSALLVYRNIKTDPLPEVLGILSTTMRNKFYFDELYDGIIQITHEATSRFADWFDRWIISGCIVRGAHSVTEFIGRALRLLQTGNLQTYMFIFGIGAAVLMYYLLKI